MTAKNTLENADRWFWSRTVKNGDCLDWNGPLDDCGYGRIRIDGRNYTTGQAAFFVKHGKFPEGEACHTCDNPSCVNPEHIFDGTHKENMRDMANKGRSGVLRGFDNPNTKLSDEDLRMIAARRNNGEPPRFIAADYGIRREVVYLIATGKYRRKF